MKGVTVITHPLVQHYLTRLRDRRTRPQEFRRALGEMASLMLYEATRDFASEAVVPVIASGGVSSLDDLRALAAAGIHGVICGRALYDGVFTLKEAIAAAK